MHFKPYAIETTFLFVVTVLAAAGFWDIYFGARASPTAYQNLHAVTSFAWLGLLLIQIRFVASRRVDLHRRIGGAILVAGPVVVASTAMLSVHSAAKGLAAGEADQLIVQNVGVTLELALLIVLAFMMLRRPKVHGALLLSTAVLFGGIALFFALLSFAPPFQIDGPETFYRFGTAAMTAAGCAIGVAVLLFLNDRQNGWPYVLVALLIIANNGFSAMLSSLSLLDPLTRIVGSLNAPATFIVALAGTLGLLFAVGIRRARPSPNEVPG